MAENFQINNRAHFDKNTLHQELKNLTDELGDTENQIDILKREFFCDLILQISRENDECIEYRIKSLVESFCKKLPFNELTEEYRKEIAFWIDNENSFGSRCREYLDGNFRRSNFYGIAYKEKLEAVDYERYVFSVYTIGVSAIFYEADMLSNSEKEEAKIFISQRLSTEILNVNLFLGKDFGLEYFFKKITETNLLRAFREELSIPNNELSEEFNDWSERNWNRVSAVIGSDLTSEDFDESEFFNKVSKKLKIDTLKEKSTRIQSRIGVVIEEIRKNPENFELLDTRDCLLKRKSFG